MSQTEADIGTQLRHLANRVPVVLAVDDQEPNIRLIGTILTQAGLEVIPAMAGDQALARARNSSPDLVLLDMMMPGMDGLAVMRALRERPETALIPVIFVTAAHEREHLVRAFQAGAVDYVTKPFVAEELLARVRTHLELKLIRDRYQRVAREREELAAMVAHDLKNPLSSIHFAAQLLQRSSESSRKPEELGRVILEATDSALEFIKHHLERRAEGELLRRFERIPVKLCAISKLAVDRFEIQAQAKGTGLNYISGECPDVAGDPMAITHVLENLISNALKFSPSGSLVEVTVGESAPGLVRAAVLDRGPGVSESDQRQLFRRFVNLANRPTGDESSSGLGLALAKQDIEQMNGELWYEDRPGGGSVFAFELPIYVDP